MPAAEGCGAHDLRDLCRVRMSTRCSPAAQLLLQFYCIGVGGADLGERCRVLITASIIGNNVKDKTADALDAQISRHLDSASYEISAATQKRFKVVQDALVSPVAYALRDAVEKVTLASGATGYPLDVPPTVLDWNFNVESPSIITPNDQTSFPGRGLSDLCLPVGAAGTECSCVPGFVPDSCRSCLLMAGTGECELVPSRLDTTTSAVYYSAGTAYSQANRETERPTAANPPSLSAHDTQLIEATAAIDHWLVPLYERHTAIQQVYVGLELRDHDTAAFRHFPGKDATTETGSLFGCNRIGSVGFCYDASARGWYNTARTAGRESNQGDVSTEQGLGKTIVTDPYQDAGSGDWMISIARAVYKRNSNELIGVVGVDMLLSTIRESILDWQMLQTGFAMLVDARHKTIVAAPAHIYNPGPNDPTKDICELMPAVCSSLTISTCGGGSTSSDDDEDTSFSEFEHDGTTFVFKSGCVQAEQPGVLTHAVLLMVQKEEIRGPIAAVNEKWAETASFTLLLVSLLSAATLILITAALVQLGTSITTPIVIMSDVAKHITEHVFDDDEGGSQDRDSGLQKLQNTTPKPDEIGDLLKEFTKMVSGISNDSERAKAEQKAALEADPKSKYPPNPLHTQDASLPEGEPLRKEAAPVLAPVAHVTPVEQHLGGGAVVVEAEAVNSQP